MLNVSRETRTRLDAYADLLRKWNSRINLVSQETLSELHTRHISDSWQLAELIGDSRGAYLDLGSGGGLPGLVIAIADPQRPATLVESDARKCAFLRTVARELDLQNVTVTNERIEAAEPANSEHISARALAPMTDLLAYVYRHISPTGVAWLMKGRNWRDEVLSAESHWKFNYISHQSRSQPGAAILKVTDIQHV